MQVSEIVELSSGVDALYLSGRAVLPPDLLTRLEEARAEATELNSHPPFQFGELETTMAPHSWGKYRYCLRHATGQIGLTARTGIPSIRYQPRAEFLHGVGPRFVAAYTHDQLGSECGAVRLSVSRVDLAVDFQGFDFLAQPKDHFVTRANNRVTYEEDQVVTGLQFGTRKTGTVHARVYDKTKDIARTGADFWFDIWGDRYELGQPVTRLEFEINRAALRQYGLDSPDQVLDAAGSIWLDLTNSWLTLRRPTNDRTKSRWPVHAAWEEVRRANFSEEFWGIRRTYEGKRIGELRKLMPALTGYLVSFAALTNANSIEDILNVLPHELKQYERKSSVTMPERISRRKREIALI